MTERDKFGGILFQVVEKDKKVEKEKCIEIRRDEENYERSCEKKNIKEE